MAGREFFTSKEDAYIRRFYRRVSGQAIADALGKTRLQIWKRAKKLGIAQKLRRWQEWEDQIIKKSWGSRPLREVAKELRRRSSEVSDRARKVLNHNDRWRNRPEGTTKDGYLLAGTRKNERGEYVRLMEHTKVMEEVIGRQLTQNERVHHIDGNRLNNNPENLYLCESVAAHRRSHMSVERMMPELLKLKIIRFNRKTGLYTLTKKYRRAIETNF